MWGRRKKNKARKKVNYRKRGKARAKKSPPKTHWIILPFEDGKNDLLNAAEAYVTARKSDAGSPTYIIKQLGPDTDLSKVSPKDTLEVFAHGMRGDPDNFYSDTKNPEQKSSGELASQLMDCGLNPKGVEIELAVCHSGGHENLYFQEAVTSNTLAKTFTEAIGTEVVKRGTENAALGMPAHVDGYVGTFHANFGPPGEKNTQRYSRGVQLDTLTNKMHEGERMPEKLDMLQSGVGMHALIRVYAKQNYGHRRAIYNRLRYTISPDTTNDFKVELNQQDYERAQAKRKELGGPDPMPIAPPRPTQITQQDNTPHRDL